AAGKGVVRRPVLLLAQQYVAPFFSNGAGQKPAARGEKAQVHASLSAGAHQGWGSPAVGEAQDPLQGVQGEPGGLFPLHADYYVLSVQGEVAVLRQDKQGVQQFSHGGPSSHTWARMYWSGFVFWQSLGRHSSLREQALQCL